MEKLNRAAKCSILGPQNLGSGGGARAPGAPPGSAAVYLKKNYLHVVSSKYTLQMHIKCCLYYSLICYYCDNKVVVTSVVTILLPIGEKCDDKLNLVMQKSYLLVQGTTM